MLMLSNKNEMEFNIKTGFLNDIFKAKREHLPILFLLLMVVSCRKVDNESSVKESQKQQLAVSEQKHYPCNDTISSENKVITIDNQIWMTKNLDVITFRNGDTILHAQSDEDWEKAGNDGIPAWCYYLNMSCLGHRDGKLYNSHAVLDERGLAPEGWHIPDDEEWKRMTDYFNKDIGYILKSDYGWYNGGNGRNTNGFNAFPGGMRYYDGEFLYHGTHGFWWTSSSVVLTHAWFRYLTNDYSDRIFRQKARRGAGMSVRCVKDYN